MIIWIPSYPKSGNTWVRAFLSSYLYSPDGLFNFDLLKKIGEFPDHNILNKFMDEKNFHNLSEVSKHWINVQKIINQRKKATFLKTHSALCSINDNKFTNKANTLAFIYVVRDPRNVILSLSNHFGVSQEKSLDLITNKKYITYPKYLSSTSKSNLSKLPASLVGSWGYHYSSWKSFDAINKIFVKFEDLVNNTKETFKKIIIFLNEYIEIEYDEKRMINSINSTQFHKLKKYEEKHGFDMGQKNKFFYLGKENNWEKFLNHKVEKIVREIFFKEMNELEYI